MTVVGPGRLAEALRTLRRMGTPDDAHHRPGPGDMDATEQLLAALRSITAAQCAPAGGGEPSADGAGHDRGDA